LQYFFEDAIHGTLSQSGRKGGGTEHPAAGCIIEEASKRSEGRQPGYSLNKPQEARFN